MRCVPLPSPPPTDLTRSAQSDWEESSDEENKPAAPAPVAPPKKKGNLKQKLAEKEAAKAKKAAKSRQGKLTMDAAFAVPGSSRQATGKQVWFAQNKDDVRELAGGSWEETQKLRPIEWDRLSADRKTFYEVKAEEENREKEVFDIERQFSWVLIQWGRS